MVCPGQRGATTHAAPTRLPLGKRVAGVAAVVLSAFAAPPVASAAVVPAGHVLLGAAALGGATYHGDIESFSGYSISFKVSANAREVTDLQVPQPLQLACLRGEAGPPDKTVSSPALIAKGVFTATAKYVSEQNKLISIKVMGHFSTGGEESGRVTFIYNFTPKQVQNLESEWGCKPPFKAVGTYTTRASGQM